LKSDSKHNLLVYADGVNILGGSINTLDKITEALSVIGNKTGLEVNPEKTMCMILSHEYS
jgi:hypothetical protein